MDGEFFNADNVVSAARGSLNTSADVALEAMISA
jgi:hypothetical protein